VSQGESSGVPFITHFMVWNDGLDDELLPVSLLVLEFLSQVMYYFLPSWGLCGFNQLANPKLILPYHR
jgi:hypothetical protein